MTSPSEVEGLPARGISYNDILVDESGKSEFVLCEKGEAHMTTQ